MFFMSRILKLVRRYLLYYETRKCTLVPENKKKIGNLFLILLSSTLTSFNIYNEVKRQHLY